MDFNNGKVRVLVLKGEKGDRGDDGITVTYLLSKNGNTVQLIGSDGTGSIYEDNSLEYTEQDRTTVERFVALANAGLHVGRIPPENVTTDIVPVGELYLYIND